MTDFPSRRDDAPRTPHEQFPALGGEQFPSMRSGPGLASGEVSAQALADIVTLISTIQSSPEGSTTARYELDKDGLRLYDDTNTLVVELDATDGSALIVGTITNDVAGNNRVVIDPTKIGVRLLNTDGTEAGAFVRYASTTVQLEADKIRLGAQKIVLLDTEAGYWELPETTAPAAPASNYIRLYPKDKAGTSALYAKDDAGTEHELTNRVGFNYSVIPGFYFNNLTGTVSDQQMVRIEATAGAFIPVTMDRPGSVVGISVASNAARTAGTATFEVWKNGIATGLTAVLNATNTQYFYGTQATGTDTFIAGNRLDVRFTTSGWTPTTADVEAVITVAYD